MGKHQSETETYCLVANFFFRKDPRQGSGHSSVTSTEAPTVIWTVLQISPADRCCSTGHSSPVAVYSPVPQRCLRHQKQQKGDHVQVTQSISLSAYRAGQKITFQDTSQHQFISFSLEILVPLQARQISTASCNAGLCFLRICGCEK